MVKGPRIEPLNDVRVPAPELERAYVALLVRAGADPGEAATLAGILRWCDASGRHEQGGGRLPILLERVRRGVLASPAPHEWTSVAPAMRALDAGNGFGQLAALAATDVAMELAAEYGIGASLVRRSNHFGAAAFFCARAAAKGFLTVVGSNSYPKVAPHGGARAALGTNPLAFGAPTAHGAPVLVDLATSALAGSAVRTRQSRSARLPADAAIDRDGLPTRDPAALAEGALLPAAGVKGYGLAVMVELLAGALTGASVALELGSQFDVSREVTDTGHIVVAIAADRSPARPSFPDAARRLVDALHSVPARAGWDPVRHPGERTWRSLEEAEEIGVSVPGHVRARLDEVAASLGVDLPW